MFGGTAHEEGKTKSGPEVNEGLVSDLMGEFFEQTLPTILSGVEEDEEMDLDTASPQKLIELGFTVGGSVMLQAVQISRPWSDKPPETPGAYYLRTPDDEHTRLVWLAKGQVFEIGVSSSTAATDPRWEGAKWAGPIPMPSDGRP